MLPVFSSVAAMGRWDAAARPVPADGVRTALAASADDTDLIVIDPGSETEFVIRRPAVWAIAQGIAWEPSFASPEVFAGLQESVGGELAVLDLAVEPGDPTRACAVPSSSCGSTSSTGSSRPSSTPCSRASRSAGPPITASPCSSTR